MTTAMESDGRYWYGTDDDAARGRRVLQAMRLYQAAEVAMRRRTRQAMAMGENDMLVLRYVIRAGGQHRSVTPTDIAKYLGISTASTTALLDRLEQSQHLVRTPHPTDRRRVLVSHTERADEEVRATLGDMHERMLSTTRGMTDEDASVVVAFLERMRAAVDELAVDAAEGSGRP